MQLMPIIKHNYKMGDILSHPPNASIMCFAYETYAVRESMCLCVHVHVDVPIFIHINIYLDFC